jgi:hypothetical protein
MLLDDEVIERAIKLRQQKKMKLAPCDHRRHRSGIRHPAGDPKRV